MLAVGRRCAGPKVPFARRGTRRRATTKDFKSLVAEEKSRARGEADEPCAPRVERGGAPARGSALRWATEALGPEPRPEKLAPKSLALAGREERGGGGGGGGGGAALAVAAVARAITAAARSL